MGNLIRAQQRCGVEVYVIVYATEEWPHWKALEGLGDRSIGLHIPKESGTASYLRLEMSSRHYRSQLSAFWEGVSSESVCCIHDAWMAGALLGHIPKSLRSKRIVGFHGAGNGALEGQPVRRWIHRRWYRKLKTKDVEFFSVDRRSPDIVADLFGGSVPQMQVIPNAVMDPFASLEAIAEKWYTVEPLRISFVGRLDEAKGWRLVVQACLAIREAGRMISLVIAGDGPEWECVRDLAVEHADWMRYTGLVSDARGEVIRHNHVVCLPSRNEGLPMVILEAMAEGAIPVATAVGGIPDLIHDGRNGLLVERSAKGLLEAIERILNGGAAALHMAMEGRAEVEKYLPGRIVAQHLELARSCGWDG